MPWIPAWSRYNPRDLPTYITKAAARSMPRMKENWWDLTVGQGRQAAARALYDQLARTGIRYVPEVVSLDADRPVQEIRAPSEVLLLERAGTCLDLATTFCGVSLWIRLLPVIVVLDGHALVALSTVHGAEEWDSFDRRQGEPDWSEGELQDAGVLRDLVDSGRYVLIECTGFAQSQALPDSVPEGRDRVDGVMSFEAACAAGRAQLDVESRPLLFATDIATAWETWGITPKEELTVVPREPARDAIHRSNEEARTSAREKFRVVSDRARGMRHQQVVGPDLPNLGAKFRDRTEQQTRISRLLRDDETRLLSVVGPGGMGKTNLVGLLVNSLLNDPGIESGVVTLSARSDGGVTVERVFDAVTRALDEEPAGVFEEVWRSPHRSVGDKIDAMLQAMSGQRLIIVLDNVELLLRRPPGIGFVDQDLTELLTRFLLAPRRSKLVMCSRQPIPVPDELMMFDECVQLEQGLPVDEAVALLRGLDPNGRTAIADADEAVLQRFAALTGGNPWALVRVFGTLNEDPLQTMSGLLDLLDTRPDPLLDLARETHDRLAVDGKAVVTALAVYGRPMPAEALSHLLEPFTPTVQVEATLRGLVRSEIISVDRVDRTYSLHRLDQQVALERLDAAARPGRAAVELRAADWWHALCQPLGQGFCALEVEPYQQRFRHLVNAGDYEAASRSIGDLDLERVVFSGWVKPIREMREQLTGHDLPPRELGLQHLALGLCHRVTGPLRTARDHLTVARHHASDADDQQTLRLSEGWLGEVLSLLGQQSAGRHHLEQALALNRQARDVAAVAWVQGDLVLRHTYAGNPGSALALFREAMNEVGDCQAGDVRTARGIGMLHDGACLAHLVRGDLAAALREAERALHWFSDLGESYLAGYVENMVGMVKVEQGALSEAVDHFERAVQLTRRDGYLRVEALARHNQALALLFSGSPADALTRSTEALEAFEGLGQGPGEPVPERAAAMALHELLAAAGRGDDTARAQRLVRCADLSRNTPDLLGPRVIQRYVPGSGGDVVLRPTA
jgi:tetratricopeptide (TPR) repeat protein